MSSVVCQGLQTCLEPRLVEPCVLRHKLTPPKSMISQPLPPSPQKPNSFEETQHADNDNINNNVRDDNNLESIKNGNTGGWNFVQALTDPSYNTKEVTDHQNDKVYVHPLVKRSASALSAKSLEMCTETFGNETGSDFSSDEFSSLSSKREEMQLRSEAPSLLWENKNKHVSKYRDSTKLLNRSCSFPPPLTSISGSDGVQVRPHRVDGRLILKAVTVCSCHTNIQADRTNGRLRLFVPRECSVNCDTEVIVKTDEEVIEHENVEDLTKVKEGEIEEELDEGFWDEEMEENGRKFGCEIGMGELPRLSRCREGGSGSKGMSSWDPFWVAIS